MRLEVKEGQRGFSLINDSYNSDINSLDIALDFLQRRGGGDSLSHDGSTLGGSQAGRKRTLILSDIYQSGMTGETLYKEVSVLCEKRGVEKFIGIGPEISAQANQINIFEKYFYSSCEEFINSDVFNGLGNEVILLKGARPFGFDRLTELLEQKVHETILEVNLNSLVDNLNYYRSYMHPETKIVCMVKADAYGAGAVEVAKTLQDHRVDYLAVAVADEGVTLRKAGITQNIMIMNPEMTSFKTMFDYELEPDVYSFRLLDALIKAARKEGITGYPVHIKLDTGMHRLGFNTTSPEIDKLIDTLQHQQAVVPRSVFSHFVGSDSVDFDEFSALQFERFDKASKRLQAAFPHKILRHMDNSAGIEHFPERQLDMCRLGIGLYGVDSIDNRILNTVSTLKTTILQMRNVPKEETVGYSRKGVLTRDSVIAAIPIGYADGLNRHLGRGRCYCLVNGKKAPYVGNICMDVAMIDVTGIDCKEGDTVEIFGSHLPVTVLSDCLDTIPYEVLTGISNRVKRVYVQE
jgi:alanine racemase